MFLHNIVEFSKRFPLLLRGAWVVGLLVWCIGGGLNLLVISANDGRMPVPVKAEDFYVIYPKYYRVALEMTPDRMLLAGKTPGYVAMTEHSRFKQLASRFYLVSPINIWEFLPSSLTIQFIRSDIPVLGHEMQASIGNILIWVADVLFLLAAFCTILFVVAKGLRARRI